MQLPKKHRRIKDGIEAGELQPVLSDGAEGLANAPEVRAVPNSTSGRGRAAIAARAARVRRVDREPRARAPHVMFEEDYVHLVIKPRIDRVLEDGVESIGDMTTKFNKLHGCRVSKNRITDWLKAIGYRVTRTVQIDGPRIRNQAPLPPPPDQQHFQTSHQQGHFNFPPPQNQMFQNVRMPGFED